MKQKVRERYLADMKVIFGRAMNGGMPFEIMLLITIEALCGCALGLYDSKERARDAMLIATNRGVEKLNRIE